MTRRELGEMDDEEQALQEGEAAARRLMNDQTRRLMNAQIVTTLATPPTEVEVAYERVGDPICARCGRMAAFTHLWAAEPARPDVVEPVSCGCGWRGWAIRVRRMQVSGR